ncbi:MAG: beta-galactosidase [Bacteroidales bacterium]|nr:beta-galactosidase [Bacteroidales bacterium]
MKKLLYLLLIIWCLSACNTGHRDTIDLSGEWRFRTDSLDRGEDEKWFETLSPETIILPGSMAENGKGDEVTLSTPWTGDIVDRSYFTDPRYAKYRQEGNIKIPFWLKPVKYYKGAAWYQKEVDIPKDWNDMRVVLFLERPHWETTVFVNGKKAGTENSLAVPHQFDITELVSEGKNLVSIRVDNRMKIPIGVNSHSVSDHTQSNWNGIAGDISLRALPEIYIDNIAVFPDLKAGKARVIVSLRNPGKLTFKGKIDIQAESFNSAAGGRIKRFKRELAFSSEGTAAAIDYPMGEDPQLWSEFNPSLYRLTVKLRKAGGRLADSADETFGMREFRAEGTRFAVNGTPVFLRGTTECCIFPLTGYPPCDDSSWVSVLQTCRDYGLNHVRFHSYCPPEAAFNAADRLGIYFHIECSSWANQGATIGDGTETDRFIIAEGERILKEYGSHPSFCMLAYGNEPAGSKQAAFLGDLVKYWKAKDNRHVYTSAAGWPLIPENEYHLTPEPRIQHWGAGLKSIINSAPPQTMYDFKDFVSRWQVPVVSHEIGQWCAYPDFTEIEKYTGPLKATNFEIFRETLTENNMGVQAADFLMASGKLQVLCYKADIEAALRTPGFAGFQLLQLHDFPGQGTALVGILNPFFGSKGYVTPEEFRMFCSQTVPLARMAKHVYSNKESFRAEVEMAHFGAKPLQGCMIISKITDSRAKVIFSDSTSIEELPIGNCFPVSSVSMNLSSVEAPGKYTFEVSVRNTEVVNRWDFWVYPSEQDAEPGKVYVTERFDSRTQSVLRNGGSVLLLACGKVGKEKGAKVAIGFSSIFWNTAWTNNQPPHTLGILCEPSHHLFRKFPTEYHSNWQWWDPVSHSQAMILNGFPATLRPLIQPVDTWFENRRLALAFEARVNGGKLFVCSVDFNELAEDRSVSKQLKVSILDYMNSSDFNPDKEVDAALISGLLSDI